MPASYRKINYSLRPSKAIERKMLLEAFRRLSNIRKVSTYRYVGLGSIYFSDFSLFHRDLNIVDMVSIEKESSDEERVLFNRPYQCVQIMFGESSEVLPTLNWQDQCTITWLDYDDPLCPSMLEDIRLVCSQSTPGSLIIVSVNAEPGYHDDENDYLDNLKARVGDENVPLDVKGDQLRGWGLAQVYRRIVTDKIGTTLSTRNIGRARNNILFRQLFNFHYADGAKMLTVGGIIYDEGQTHQLQACSFDELPFIKTDSDAFRIKVPNLTFRELRHLSSQFPRPRHSGFQQHGIPEKEIEQYEGLYRYFPSYMTAELD